MILKEKELLAYLNIPSIPKKKWDGIKSFKDGVAVITTISGRQYYAVATFDSEQMEQPKIKHVFSVEPFKSIGDIYVVPSYMDDDVDGFDMDDESKKRAEAILEEAHELEMRGVETEESVILENKNEYFFDNITTDEEAMAFIKAYNKMNKIGGKVPTKHESIVLRLAVIYNDEQKKMQE